MYKYLVLLVGVLAINAANAAQSATCETILQQLNSVDVRLELLGSESAALSTDVEKAKSDWLEAVAVLEWMELEGFPAEEQNRWAREVLTKKERFENLKKLLIGNSSDTKIALEYRDLLVQKALAERCTLPSDNL